jgi:hypothetical protein
MGEQDLRLVPPGGIWTGWDWWVHGVAVVIASVDAVTLTT